MASGTAFALNVLLMDWLQVRKRPLNKKELAKNEEDIITIKSHLSSLTVHETKLKVSMSARLIYVVCTSAISSIGNGKVLLFCFNSSIWAVACST